MKERKTYKSKLCAPDVSVLVVDDNVMNLKVVKMMLKPTRMKVSTCASGAECLELIKKYRYDIILMDHMMPEMDGMETFRRAMLMRDSLCGRSTYIVMTANAVMGAREMYLAEGFKDYISKPVQPEVLEDILMRYIPEDKLVDPMACDEDQENSTIETGTEDDTTDEKTDVMGRQHKAAEESCAAEKCDNMTRDGLPKQDTDTSWKAVHIDHEKGLTYCGGSEDFLKEIISMYVADDKRTEIQKAFGKKDWDSYRILIHTVKSTSRTIGAMELGDEAQELENAVKELDVDMICKMHESVMASYSAVLDWCRVTTAR